MANPGHVSLLLDGGVDRWNLWRQQNPGLVPDLVEADFLKADLAGGSGTGANLYSANLEGANLFGTNLQGVNLRDANLRSAKIGFTIFGDVNLGGAIGLDSCHHLGPSVIDHQTWRNRGPSRSHYYEHAGSLRC
jgi:hypothetical protein